MSTAPADGAAPNAPPKRTKKLLIVVGLVVVVLLGAGGAAWALLKKQPPPDADDAETATEAAPKARSGPPSFAPLDPFTVNLADRETERYAQIGISLELEGPKDAETVKQYTPAIRHRILMVLAHKTSAELLGREGKQQLADELRREVLRALEHGKGTPPVRAVQFSNFIIQ